MAYAAYESNRDGTDFSFRERDEGRGILGKLTTDREPVAVAETLDDLRACLRSLFGVAWASCPRVAGPSRPCIFTGKTLFGLVGGTPLPLSKQALRLEARAYLGENPEVMLYLTDSEDLVHEILINKKHHAAVNGLARRSRILTALLVLCTTSLLGSAAGFGGWSLVAFAAATTIYLAIIKIGIFNEIEGAAVCEILLILTIVLIPGIQRAIQLRAGHHP